MTDHIHDYEQVSVYALDDAQREELLRTHVECTFNWSTRDGWPMGVIMSYLWRDGRFWLTGTRRCGWCSRSCPRSGSPTTG